MKVGQSEKPKACDIKITKETVVDTGGAEGSRGREWAMDSSAFVTYRLPMLQEISHIISMWTQWVLQLFKNLNRCQSPT